MKAIYWVALSLSALLSACAGGTFQTAGEYESGKQALYAGNYPTALAYFQQAAQNNPNAVYGATLRLGILTYVGQTQYLTGNYAGARQTLRKELSQHPSDNVALLYLGLTEARLGNRQAALGHIENGMKGIASFLNYITTNFAYSFGQYLGSERKYSCLDQNRSRDDLRRKYRLAGTDCRRREARDQD